MDIRGMAEMIIMQSISDLWHEEEWRGSMDFFKGEGFMICAELAGIDLHDQCRVLGMVRRIVKQTFGIRATIRNGQRDGCVFSADKLRAFSDEDILEVILE